MEKAVDGELTKLMLEGLEPEKTVEEQAIDDAAFDAEIKEINDMPVDMTARERVEAFYGKDWTVNMDDEQVNELLNDMLEGD